MLETPKALSTLILINKVKILSILQPLLLTTICCLCCPPYGRKGGNTGKRQATEGGCKAKAKVDNQQETKLIFH
jgi:hypothetical protein